jgi:hypothetical protein
MEDSLCLSNYGHYKGTKWGDMFLFYLALFIVFFVASCDSRDLNSAGINGGNSDPNCNNKIENSDEQMSYSWKIIDNELRIDSNPTDSAVPVLRIKIDKDKTYSYHAGSWQLFSKLNSVTDKEGIEYSLSTGNEYKIDGGMLYVLFGDVFLLYDYNFLSYYLNDLWDFRVDSVNIKFGSDVYSKGQNFVQFCRVDNIYSNQKNLEIFINTDIEVEYDFTPIRDTTYIGLLKYVRDTNEHSKADWNRRNFYFERY